MRDPRNKIEQFCYRHPNFGIPNLMRYITIANVAFWLLGSVNRPFLSFITFSPALILRGQIWRLFTFMLFPPSTGILAFLIFYFYYWIGDTLEKTWGTGPFNFFFFSGVILTALYGFVVYFFTGYSINMDSTYLYFSMFLAYAVMYPDMQVLFMFFIPLKMKYLAVIDLVYFLYGVIAASFPINMLPIVALINFFIFCGGDLRAMRPQKPSKSTINFRKESAKIRREQQNKLYTHRCSVCGKTDTDYPGLEFRYCSRCQGYHCFCSEHINNHIHFTE